jgi:arginase
MTPIIYAGVAADRNERAMLGAVQLGRKLSEFLDSPSSTVSQHQPVIAGGWLQQLEYARPSLTKLSEEFDQALNCGATLLVAGRCAASIATLPKVAAYHPDAVLVWFDAHGDCNIPSGDKDAYLGGMVISAAVGAWESGFGGGFAWKSVILVGSRDLDPPELDRIASGQIALVEVGPNLGKRLAAAVGSRKVYVHLDCDVLDAGLLATEYQVPGGLSWSDLYDACQSLADFDVVGFEIAEYEATWPDGRPNDPEQLLQAIKPLVDNVQSA